MFIAMKPHATQADFDAVIEKVRSLGLTPHPISGTERRVVAVVGNTGAVDPDDFAMLTGVAEALRVSQPFKLVSREVKEEDTVIDVDGVQVGGRAITVMAGPCSVESREQILETARAVKAAGARILRGGAWKPRTSPYEFQGLREEGLKLLALAREETGLKVITEVMSTDTVDLVAGYADILQVGARNMQNYALLERLGKVRKPVMLKRGLSGTIKEWLMAAEYIVAKGNPNVMLCERGIRTFETATRNTLDLSAIPVLRRLTHLPVLVDPSHAAGERTLVPPMALAARAVGAHGVMIEIHPEPAKALSDGPQALTFDGFTELMPALCAERP